MKLKNPLGKPERLLEEYCFDNVVETVASAIRPYRKRLFDMPLESHEIRARGRDHRDSWGGLGLDRVAERADGGNGHLDVVARDKRRDALGRAGGNDVAGFKGDVVRNVSD